MNDDIQSPSGKRMLNYISPIYYSSRVMQRILEKTGWEIDDLHEWIPDIQKQLFPQAATWGLMYWEDLVGLPTNVNESYQVRRNKVISKIQQRWPVSVKKMERIISNASGEIAVVIVQNVSDYTDRIEFVNLGEPLNLIEIAKNIDEAKPAHRAYEMCVVGESHVQLQTDYKKYSFLYSLCGSILCGTVPGTATIGRVASANIDIGASYSSDLFSYPPCGTLLCGTYP